MARPQKVGLDYFPVDVDMCNDDKIYMLEVECGLEGLALFMKLLMKIYDNGYYIKWREKDAKIFAHKNSVEVNVINNLIKSCLSNHLFDPRLHEEEKILTSAAIQKRYFKATSRRKEVEYNPKYMLVDVSNYNNLVNVNNNPAKENLGDVSGGKSTQSKEQKRREDNKGKDKKEKEGATPPKFDKNSKPYEYAVKLRKLILENNERQPVPDKNPKDLERWCIALDKLHRLGPKGGKDAGYSWEKINKIIEWCQQDEFWWQNILSATKLREQIVKLENQMKADKKKNKEKVDIDMSDYDY